MAGIIDPETGRPNREQARSLYELDRFDGLRPTRYTSLRRLLGDFHYEGSVITLNEYADTGLCYFGFANFDIPGEVLTEISEAVHEAARAAIFDAMGEYAAKVAPVAQGLTELRITSP